MSDLDEWRRAVEPAVQHFLSIARRAFEPLATLGYSEMPVDDDIPFTLSWSDGRTVVKCAGVHWGTAADTSIGSEEQLFSLWRLVDKVRPGLLRSALGQDQQILEDAQVLFDVARPVLRGDHSLFVPLAADSRCRAEATLVRAHAEEARLIAEGWAEVESPLGLALVPPESEFHPGFKKPT